MTPRDPFEHMKNTNPVPPGTEPSAPMSMADRIVGARTGWPGWAMGVAAAAAVLVIGFVSILVIDSGDDDIVAGSSSTTTTSVADGETATTDPSIVTSTTVATTVPGSVTTLDPSIACSGALVDDELVPQLELPPEVVATRAAIFEAAVSCDWDTLRELAGGELKFTFGAVTQDAITAWQRLEETLDAQPMRYLAELLNRSYGTQPGPEDQLYYAWPSAFVVPWSDVTEEQREELRPLFGDQDFAVFDDFGGYIGDRIGILSDGTWAYFVAGD